MKQVKQKVRDRVWNDLCKDVVRQPVFNQIETVERAVRLSVTRWGYEVVFSIKEGMI